MKLVFLHGNGGCTADMHWYISAEKAFREAGLDVVRQTLPDNDIAHEEIWIPFIRDQLKADENTVLIGHSSGAIAALRYGERYPLLGTVLVSAYHTHLDMEDEKAGGWFDRPWDWEAIRSRQPWIIQFASIDDPWIPIKEARFIRDQLFPEYHEFSDRGHFIEPDHCEFPELVQAVLNKVALVNQGMQ